MYLFYIRIFTKHRNDGGGPFIGKFLSDVRVCVYFKVRSEQEWNITERGIAWIPFLCRHHYTYTLKRWPSLLGRGGRTSSQPGKKRAHGISVNFPMTTTVAYVTRASPVSDFRSDGNIEIQTLPYFLFCFVNTFLMNVQSS